MSSKVDQNREKIVRSADDLFYRRGFSRTSFADLAKAAEIPKGNFYYYYKAKDELLLDVIGLRLVSISAQLEHWNRQYTEPKKRLRAFIGMVSDNSENLSLYGCPMGSLNTELGKEMRELQTAARQMFDTYIQWLEHQFAEYTTAAQARSNAYHLMAMVQGASLLCHALGDGTLIEREVERILAWLDAL